MLLAGEHKSNLAEEELRILAEAFFGRSRGFVNPVTALSLKPVCVNCGKQYGVKDTRLHVAHYGIGQTIQPYDGTDALISEAIEVGPHMGPEGSPGCRVTRQTWDRRTYHAVSMSDPFCKLSCAAKFAAAAYRAGYRRIGRIARPAP
jgi:hypothetical protein